jgi:hypothetical protein
MLTLTRVKAKQHPDIQTVAAIVRFFNAHRTRKFYSEPFRMTLEEPAGVGAF